MKLDARAHDQLVENLTRHLHKQGGGHARVYRTHISSVVVCGELAYKLKRPVKLPFVDFSSLRLRKQDCQRELRINQRTAPALYLGIIKITGSLHEPRLGGAGKAIDWAVKMRRFEQAALLSHRIKRNAISSEMAQQLGQHLAEFTNGLPSLKQKIVKKHRPTKKWLLESLAEITAVFPTERGAAESISSWVNQHTNESRQLIAKRQRDGFYRDCHGDLHLSNLVKLNHGVVAFDALEFNRELSQIDVINDIAFAFMDLLAFERPDLAWAMINQWCEHTGDYNGLPLLRYYTLYRAVVRAKVAALTDGPTDSEAFDRYWSLAKRLIRPANAPHLILVAGLSGSGKSTVARELASALSGIQVRADVIRKQLFAHALDNPKQLYAKQATHRTYRQLSHIADKLLHNNMTVIVDATFLSQEQVNLFDKLAREHKTGLHIVHCQAPVAVLKQRINKRSKAATDPSDATVAVLQKQIERLRNNPIFWPRKPITIKTDKTYARMTSHIRAIARKILTKNRP